MLRSRWYTTQQVRTAVFHHAPTRAPSARGKVAGAACTMALPLFRKTSTVLRTQYARSLTYEAAASAAAAGQHGYYATYVQAPGDGRKHTVTLLPGAGIGPELCRSVRDVFYEAKVPVSWEIFTASECSNADGSPSERIKASLRKNKVGLKGTFLTKVGSEGPRSLNVQLRQELDMYANLIRAYNVPGHTTRHKGIDLALIRENTEGEYSGMEHEVVPGVVESLKLISEPKCRRLAEYAFEFAFLNGRKRVHAVHKANIMKQADGLFLKCVREVAKRYPNIKYDEVIVDNCCMQLVSNPQQFDVLVMPNLYGNVICNIVSALTGGPGVTPGANVGQDVVVFEQGTRDVGKDIQGKNVVNPTAFLFSSVMMLRHLSLPWFADSIETALLSVLAEGKHKTHDNGGTASTTDFTQAVISKVHSLQSGKLTGLAALR